MLLSGLLFYLAVVNALPKHQDDKTSGRKPIMLDRSGGFEIGGKVLVNPKNPNQTLSCDHGYVEFVSILHIELSIDKF